MRMSIYLYEDHLPAVDKITKKLNIYPKELLINYIAYLLETGVDFNKFRQQVKAQERVHKLIKNTRTKSIRIRVDEKEKDLIQYFYNKIGTDFTMSAVLDNVFLLASNITIDEYQDILAESYVYLLKFSRGIRINTIITNPTIVSFILKNSTNSEEFILKILYEHAKNF